MLSSAGSASLLILATLAQDGIQKQQAFQWSQIQPSVATVLRGGRPQGVAVLIHASGLFLASTGSAAGGAVDGRDYLGRPLQFRVRAVDDPTQLALLEAVGWTDGQARPVTVASIAAPGTHLFAATPTGFFRVELETRDRFGLISRSESRRVLPLSELRFENPSQSTGAAALFNSAGELVGLLDATLKVEESVPLVVQGLKSTSPLPGKTTEPARALGNVSRYGPNPLSVGYAVAPAVLERVVRGFLAPDRTVRHPVIGVFCRDAEGGGALVETVVSGSPAERSGLRPGDIILEISGKRISNQIAFSGTMMMQKPGAQIVLRVRRERQDLQIPVVVGP
jgi:hypothetical protein